MKLHTIENDDGSTTVQFLEDGIVYSEYTMPSSKVVEVLDKISKEKKEASK
jgi:hypothetical protein